MTKSNIPLPHKLPPQSIEAEESLLSAMLIDNKTIVDVAEVLSPEDFYKPAHQKIFEAIVHLYNINEPVDLVTLSNRLKSNGKLDKIGGASYLARIIETVPVAANVAHYARIVHDKSTLRRLFEKGHAIVQKCLENRDSVGETIDWAEKGIFKISERKIEPTFFQVEKLLSGCFETLATRCENKGQLSGVPSGFEYLDDLTSGFQPSDLIILAARPSMGKTALALNIARNAAIKSDIPVVIYSLEMSKEQLAMRMLSAEARVDSYNIRQGYLFEKEWKALYRAGENLNDAPIYIDDSSDTTVLKLRAKSRRLQREKGLGLIIIDYLQLMKVQNTTDRRDLDIAEISRSLKGLAKELNDPVIALSQLNRALENRDDKTPRLADLRESGSLEQDADLVVFIHRPEVFKKDKDKPSKNDGKAEIIVAKQRNGPTNTIKLTFLKQYTRFENLAKNKIEDRTGN